jgi:hypothetical protein
MVALESMLDPRLDGVMAGALEEHSGARPFPWTRSVECTALRVGGLRILFRVDGFEIIVAEIGPRGQIYKRGG